MAYYVLTKITTGILNKIDESHKKKSQANEARHDMKYMYYMNVCNYKYILCVCV